MKNFKSWRSETIQLDKIERENEIIQGRRKRPFVMPKNRSGLKRDPPTAF
jgi:hypothetical protein